MTINKSKDKLIIRQGISWAGVFVAMGLFVALYVYFRQFAEIRSDHRWPIFPAIILLYSLIDIYQFDFDSKRAEVHWRRQALFFIGSSRTMAYSRIKGVQLECSKQKRLGILTTKYTIQLKTDDGPIPMNSFGMSLNTAQEIFQALKETLPAGIHFNEIGIDPNDGSVFPVSSIALVMWILLGVGVIGAAAIIFVGQRTGEVEMANSFDVSSYAGVAEARLVRSPVIIDDIGMPMTMNVREKQTMHTSQGVTVYLDVSGPRGKGTCEVLYVPSSASLAKAETYILFWYFGGKNTQLTEDGHAYKVF